MGQQKNCSGDGKREEGVLLGGGGLEDDSMQCNYYGAAWKIKKNELRLPLALHFIIFCHGKFVAKKNKTFYHNLFLDPNRSIYLQEKGRKSEIIGPYVLMVDFVFGRRLLSFHWGSCCIFQPGFGCCTLQILVKISFFQVFGMCSELRNTFAGLKVVLLGTQSPVTATSQKGLETWSLLSTWVLVAKSLINKT